MEANRADFWSFGTDADVSAVSAFPDCHTALAEYFVSLYVFQQFAVTLLMGFLYGCHSAELFCKIMKSFGIGIFCKTVIHVGPFIVFTLGCMLQVYGRVLTDTAESLAPQFGVFFLVGCSMFENRGDLLESVFACN